MKKRIYTHKAYGLIFASTFRLPELGAEISGEPDITIDYGDVPEELESASVYGIAWQASPGKALLTVSDVARYLVLDDNKIIIEALPGSSEREVRIFLLGSVLGALLHARQMLVLHSSVVKTKHGAVLFMGNSGAGKSTMAGAFLKRGYFLLSDDKAGIVLDKSGVAQVMPGFPTIRLTPETIGELGIKVDSADQSPGLGKFVLPIERFCGDPVAFHSAYAMSSHNKNEILIQELDSLEQFEALNKNTYRRKFVHSAERKQAHFRIMSALSSQVKVRKVLRPIDSSRIEEVVDRIEEDFSL